MTRNVKLKAAIFKSGKPSKQVANESGLSPSTLSMATTGRYILDDSQKKSVARVLKCEVWELFTD